MEGIGTTAAQTMTPPSPNRRSASSAMPVNRTHSGNPRVKRFHFRHAFFSACMIPCILSRFGSLPYIRQCGTRVGEMRERDGDRVVFVVVFYGFVDLDEEAEHRSDLFFIRAAGAGDRAFDLSGRVLEYRDAMLGRALDQ